MQVNLNQNLRTNKQLTKLNKGKKMKIGLNSRQNSRGNGKRNEYAAKDLLERQESRQYQMDP